jgi:hypothetical protein
VSSFEFPWRLLGELLVAKDLIGSDELEAALAEQRRSRRRLGEILVDRGALSAIQLLDVLAEQYGVALDDVGASAAPAEPEPGDWRPLGRILVARGELSQTALDEALAAQRATGRRLGEILVDDHGVTMLALASALGAQHGIAPGRTAASGSASHKADDSIYEVVLPGRPALFRTDSFLEATDFAFEYREAEEPSALEILRVLGDRAERVWEYQADAEGLQDLVELYGFQPQSWTGPPRAG